MSPRKVDIAAPVMKKNDEIAADLRESFARNGIFVINVISSPGSGKTTLLEQLARELGPAIAVIEGDVQTRRDAERLERAGCRVHQIETGGACHLNARNVADAVEALQLTKSPSRILIIENVGNLVCPSGVDLGEHMKVAILSLPEGDDKILKYPSVFTRIGALLINKIDLESLVHFDVERVVRECSTLNSDFRTFRLSAKTGEGVRTFSDFLLEKADALVG